MAHNRIGQATTEPFVSCDCVTIVDIGSVVHGVIHELLTRYCFVRENISKGPKAPRRWASEFLCKRGLNRQFCEIKFHPNTIFLRDREIKDSRNVLRKFSRNLSPAKIKENKVRLNRARISAPNDSGRGRGGILKWSEGDLGLTIPSAL